jgi:putative nucleotidyltransferase with HDIG domain
MNQLRVGLYVHLDMSWMAHPFPVGSFKISSEQQIAALRQLGKARLRWDPSRSDSADAVAPAIPMHVQAVAAPSQAALPALTPNPEAQCGRPLGQMPSPAVARGPSNQPAPQAFGDALKLCERQFAEAGHELEQAMALVASHPAQAGAQAGALAQTIAQKMLDAGEINLRLVVEPPGDRTLAHALNVAVLSMLMGRSFGMGPQDLRDLGVGALLHDVGKLDLPLRVRHPSDGMTTSERDYYREHVERGVAMGRRMELSEAALAVIAQHHEQADGRGFPRGIGVDQMGALSRIVALVNRYDRLCNPHLPALAITPHEALSQLFTQGQSQFDTSMLNAFVKQMGVYPPGSIVQLTDDRYAVVISVHSARPLRPSIVPYQPDVPREQATVLNLDEHPGLSIRRSLRPLALPREVQRHLATRGKATYYFEPVQALGDAPAAAADGMAAGPRALALS